MNKQQKEYAFSRISTIVNKKIKLLDDKYSKRVNLSSTQRMKAIREGDYTLKSIRHVYLYTEINDVFEFNAEKVDPKLLREKAKEVEKLNIEAQRIKDEIMMGDAEEALRLIRQFEG